MLISFVTQIEYTCTLYIHYQYVGRMKILFKCNMFTRWKHILPILRTGLKYILQKNICTICFHLFTKLITKLICICLSLQLILEFIYLHLYISMYVCLYICLSIRLSVYPSVCLSVCLSITMALVFLLISIQCNLFMFKICNSIFHSA